MTASRDPDRLIRAFLDEGEERLHDQIYDAVRAAIEQRRQRALVGLWRTPIMNKFVAIGLGAAAVVVVGVLLGAQLLGSPSGGGIGAGATPTPTVVPTEQPTSTPAAFVPKPFTFSGAAPTAPKMTVIIPAPGWATSPFFAKGDEVDNVPEAAI
ncbi:MAG TPA: hypothetical protein VK838_02290, partial [Candidatus Limnocylindrales bacterium]|nr:hypothetical protein [Candidatus Limnocylindrales bacterium]